MRYVYAWCGGLWCSGSVCVVVYVVCVWGGVYGVCVSVCVCVVG